MHDVVFMHDLKSFEDTLHDHFYLFLGEFVFSFDLIIQLASF